MGIFDILSKDVLDSHNPQDEDSVLSRDVLIHKEKDNSEATIINYYDTRAKLVRGDKNNDSKNKKIILAKKPNEAEIDEFIARNRVLSLPTQALVSACLSLYEYAKAGGNEEGYVVADDGSFTEKLRAEDGYKLNNTLGYRYLIDLGKAPAFDIHSHPLSYLSGGGVNLEDIGVAFPLEADYLSTIDRERLHSNTEPNWILGFFFNKYKDDPEFVPRINFHTSDWVYKTLQRKIFASSSVDSLNKWNRETSSDQGMPFDEFASLVNRISKK